MDAGRSTEVTSGKNETTVERTSERELAVTRTFDAPARIVFKAWTTPDLLKQWWLPKSCGASFAACEGEFRTGGRYRFVFSHPAAEQPMEFCGRFIEVTPSSRVVWTNEESDAGQITTVTFEERDGRTLVVMRDRYPSKEALDEAIASGSTGGCSESFDQLDEVLGAMGAGVARS